VIDNLIKFMQDRPDKLVKVELTELEQCLLKSQSNKK
jgi:hypothetical protein